MTFHRFQAHKTDRSTVCGENRSPLEKELRSLSPFEMAVQTNDFDEDSPLGVVIGTESINARHFPSSVRG